MANVNSFLKKQSIDYGQEVELEFEGSKYTGFVAPQGLSETLVLKLESGYNAGFDIEKIKNLKKLSGKREFSAPKVGVLKQNHNLPKISLLHTGGTIASRVDYKTGGVVSAFTEKDLLSMFPEISSIVNISSQLISEMWSEDLRFANIKTLAQAVEKEYENGSTGIIVGMGTDNLAVASAALSFALPNCPIPVLFVGSQRSSDRPSTDAALNILSAAYFIAKTDFAGVALCMHHFHDDKLCSILPACKTKKLHTSSRNAFKPVNDEKIAFVDFYNQKIIFNKKDYKKRHGEKIEVKADFEEKILLITMPINSDPKLFEFIANSDYKGLMIEGRGLGQIPIAAPNKDAEKNLEIKKHLEKFLSNGGIAVMTSNCVYGAVNMNVYEKGRTLLNMGVISGKDMLSETAYVKLAWLLKNEPKKVKELISENMRGEINTRRFPDKEN